jgi:hypothetical protein
MRFQMSFYKETHLIPLDMIFLKKSLITELTKNYLVVRSTKFHCFINHRSVLRSNHKHFIPDHSFQQQFSNIHLITLLRTALFGTITQNVVVFRIDVSGSILFPENSAQNKHYTPSNVQKQHISYLE